MVSLDPIVAPRCRWTVTRRAGDPIFSLGIVGCGLLSSTGVSKQGMVCLDVQGSLLQCKDLSSSPPSKVLSTHFPLALKAEYFHWGCTLQRTTQKPHFRKHSFSQRRQYILPAWEEITSTTSISGLGGSWRPRQSLGFAQKAGPMKTFKKTYG